MLEKTKKKKNRSTRKEKLDEFPCNNQLSARSAAASSDALGLRVSLAGDPSGRSALMSILSFQQQQQNQGTPSSSFPAATNPRATGITYRYGQRQVKRRARPRPAAGNRSLSCRRSSSRAFGTHVGARSAGSGRPNKRISHTGRQAPPRAAPRRPSPRLASLASCDDTIQSDLARARYQPRETASSRSAPENLSHSIQLDAPPIEPNKMITTDCSQENLLYSYTLLQTGNAVTKNAHRPTCKTAVPLNLRWAA